jgi:spore cortex formation protein SpoVR/YcgB (stage V sporulation)
VDRRRRPSSTTWSSPRTTSPSARSATAGRGRAAARLLPRADEPRRRPLPSARPRSRWRQELAARKEREAYLQQQVNDLWRTLPRADKEAEAAREPRFPEEPQENLLYFIEKNAPLLEPWQREVVRIVRKVAQYFYPQRQTQVMNEGWATFWHTPAAQHLYDDGC